MFQQVEEQSNRFLLPFENMLFLLPTLTDPSPSSGQAGLSEHRRSDLHGIISRHVLSRIGSFDIEVVGLCNHAGMIGKQDRDVQRHI